MKISKDVEEHYKSTLCKKNTCPWKPKEYLDLNKIFVPLTIDIDVKGATVVKKHLNSYQDILKKSQDSKRFLLVGDPGQGKSVLCAKMAHDWCYKTALSPLKHIQLLLILQLSTIDHTSNIEGAICDQLLSDDELINRDKLREVIIKLQQSVLIVFDGADESPPDLFQHEGSVGNVLRTMRFKSLRKCRVVVTTRPWREDDVKDCHRSYERLELQRMNKSDVKTLVDKFFSQNDDPNSNIWGNALLRQIEDNKLVVDTSTPLLVVLLCWYYTETKGKSEVPVKIYELYENIINIMYGNTTPSHIKKVSLLTIVLINIFLFLLLLLLLFTGCSRSRDPMKLHISKKKKMNDNI